MEDEIGYYLKIISDKMKAVANADLKKRGLTLTQSKVLGFLNSRGGQAGQKEIETHLQVSHPTVVGLVARLEQKGFVITWRDPADRRNNIVGLTAQAAAFGKEMDRYMRIQNEKLLYSLTEEQVAELKTMLHIIYNNIG